MPVQVPSAAVSVSPSVTVPLIVGMSVLTGGVGRDLVGRVRRGVGVAAGVRRGDA